MKNEDTKKRAQEMRVNRHRFDPKAVWIKMMIFTALLAGQSEAKGVNYNFENMNKDEVVNTSFLKLGPNTNMAAMDEEIEKYIDDEAVKERLITDITKKKTQELQDEIISNINQLQADIIKAKKQGLKTALIAKLFRKVSPLSLSGTSNYCAAGAMSAYCSIGDTTIKPFVDNMLASRFSTPQDLHLFSHPNVSCPAFRIHYKQTLGANFIDRQTPDFKNKLQHLEKGDVIIVFSSQNTSSNLHCVTFEKYEEGQIFVKSLNTEKNYTIKPSRICCVAKFPNQFRQSLSQALHNNKELLFSFIKNDESLYKRLSSQSLKLPKKKVETALVVTKRKAFEIL